MRDQWYGDKRDLVKWAALVHLAHVRRARTIIQVAFYRSSEPPLLKVNGRDTQIPKAVWGHFYGLGHITRLQRPTGLRIAPWDDPFPSSAEGRRQYVKQVCGKLRATRIKKVVLLDPDTGIAPKHFNGAHVLSAEISEIWGALSSGDLLAFYQHQRRDKDWREQVRHQLASACRTRTSRVSALGSPWARDIALYAIPKA